MPLVTFVQLKRNFPFGAFELVGYKSSNHVSMKINKWADVTKYKVILLLTNVFNVSFTLVENERNFLRLLNKFFRLPNISYWVHKIECSDSWVQCKSLTRVSYKPTSSEFHKFT